MEAAAFDIVTGVRRAVFQRREDGLSQVEYWLEGLMAADGFGPHVEILSGPAYLMNDAGRTVSTFRP